MSITCASLNTHKNLYFVSMSLRVHPTGFYFQHKTGTKIAISKTSLNTQACPHMSLPIQDMMYPTDI
jgi:hypothetical protein